MILRIHAENYHLSHGTRCGREETEGRPVLPQNDGNISSFMDLRSSRPSLKKSMDDICRDLIPADV
jgi:hypothetical protein